MDLQQLQAYQQQLMNQALIEGLRRNNEQVNIWSNYKKRHEKVIEALVILPQDLSVNCMVPVGKKALMRGKITHTNEVMVCLGDGYFVKYSAPQATALCNRRIKKADEMLESLQKEKDLLEMRQMVPDNTDLFGDEIRNDVLEHTNDQDLKEWKREHRQKEKDYRRKLKELENSEKQEINSEEDLFKILDALELQEELEDELNRLEEEHENFYDQNDDEEYFDESEVDSESYSSDYSEEAINEVRAKKSISSKLNHRLQVLNSVNSSEDKFTYEKQKSESQYSNYESDSTLKKAVNCTSTNESTTNPTQEPNSQNGSFSTNKVEVDKNNKKLEVREKKVVFAEPQVKYFSNEAEMESIVEKRRISVIEQRLYEYSKGDDESDSESDQDDTIRIHFKHSEKQSTVPAVSGEEIISPRDIYKNMPSPKSILKKRLDDATVSQQITAPVEIPMEDKSDEEQEPVSAYTTIVKEITEHVQLGIPMKVTEEVQQKRPVSKFKLERAGLKK